MRVRAVMIALLLGSASFLAADVSASASAECSFAEVRFVSDFPSGRLDGCEQTGSLS